MKEFVKLIIRVVNAFILILEHTISIAYLLYIYFTLHITYLLYIYFILHITYFLDTFAINERVDILYILKKSLSFKTT